MGESHLKNNLKCSNFLIDQKKKKTWLLNKFFNLIFIGIVYRPLREQENVNFKEYKPVGSKKRKKGTLVDKRHSPKMSNLSAMRWSMLLIHNLYSLPSSWKISISCLKPLMGTDERYWKPLNKIENEALAINLI